MITKVINAIDQLVGDIYSVDQEKVNDFFLELADCLIEFIAYMEKQEYSVNIDQEAALIQEAFEKHDYTELADVLLYKVRPQFCTLLEEFQR